jgi:NAD(P)-dependent dehydrogenase (short-subunit alcohol dehydrogenase family)
MDALAPSAALNVTWRLLERTGREAQVRWGNMTDEPADVGDAVALLCSKEAGFITGQTIAVDGGASLMDAALPLPIQQPELQPA